VAVQGHTSTETLVPSGTIQGSVLGPLLFLMYVDDFGNGTDSFGNKYTDDCKFLKDILGIASPINVTTRSKPFTFMVRNLEIVYSS